MPVAREEELLLGDFFATYVDRLQRLYNQVGADGRLQTLSVLRSEIESLEGKLGTIDTGSSLVIDIESIDPDQAREIRTQRSLSQEALGRIIGCSRKYVGMLERGEGPNNSRIRLRYTTWLSNNGYESSN